MKKLNILDRVTDAEKEFSELSAKIEDAVVGRLIYRNRGRVRVYAIETDEDFRLKGIASELMHNLVKLTKERQGYVIEARLTAEQANREGEDEPSYFLWRCGFEPIHETEEYVHYELWLEKKSADEEPETEENMPEPPVVKKNPEDDQDEMISLYAQQPVIKPLTVQDMICKDCIYHTGGKDVMACHKYASKPEEVLTEDTCPNFIGY